KLYAEGISFASGWNFGPHDADTRSVSWVVERLTAAWGDGASWKLDGDPQPHEASLLKLDCSKAHTLLNWHPRWMLTHALEKIVEWHKAALTGKSLRAVTLAQIDEYQDAPLLA
ncbi:MAG TPA: CDP-glucose 4,6-dehydratase, partial [Rhodocyclaceae bacterium]|nr:CDP-glucose 4,6-dehydratase [Rhodocyclaceae bacterium]